MPTVYFSLGANLGDRKANLRAALERLRAPAVRLTGVSRFYETVHVGAAPEPVPDYLNVVARGETDLSPLALLEYTQSIEEAVGRVPTFRWGPRAIDIDLLLYDDVTLNSARLTLPHPRLFERAFVLVPLAEIAPDLVFPDGTTLAERLRDPAVQAQEIRPVQRDE